MIVYVLKRDQSMYNKSTGKRPLYQWLALLNVRPRSPAAPLMFLTDLRDRLKTGSLCELGRCLICKIYRCVIIAP